MAKVFDAISDHIVQWVARQPLSFAGAAAPLPADAVSVDGLPAVD